MTDCTENEHEIRSFFLSDFLLYCYSDFWYYRSLLYYRKFFKKSAKKKNKLRTIYPKIHNLGSNFTGSYKKKCVQQNCISENLLNILGVFVNEQHCVKSVHIWSYSGPHFPAFGRNTERYGVSLRIQSECGKIQTRITPNTDTFHAVQIQLCIYWSQYYSLFFTTYVLTF